MKFSHNGLYIERYIKCANCGVLLYEASAKEQAQHEGETYCSQWCIDWKIKRDERMRKAKSAG
jgi:hypothetical protein